MKPAAPDRIADREADGDRPGEQEAEGDEDDDADARDGRVLALQVGLRAFTHRAGDFLHALGTCVRRHDAVDRVHAVNDRQQSAEYDEP